MDTLFPSLAKYNHVIPDALGASDREQVKKARPPVLVAGGKRKRRRPMENQRKTTSASNTVDMVQRTPIEILPRPLV